MLIAFWREFSNRQSCFRNTICGYNTGNPWLFQFLMNPKESAECHQTLSSWVGSGHETSMLHVCTVVCFYLCNSLIPRPNFSSVSCGLVQKVEPEHLHWEIWDLIIKHVSMLSHQSDCSENCFVYTSSQIASLCNIFSRQRLFFSN